MKTLATNDLPDDIDVLKSLVLDKNKRIQFLEEFIAAIEEQQRLSKALKFGASSEKDVYQYSLFDEAEVAAESEEEQPTVESTIEVKSHTKRKGRAPLPDHIPTEDIVYTLEPSQQHCECGCEYICIGERVKEQIDIIPMQLKKLRHVQKQYVCRSCDNAPILAPKPKQPIPKSIASPGFLSFVATAKYVDGLPLHRLQRIFERQDIEIGRNTLANYMVQIGDQLVTPLIDALGAHVRSYDIVNMDETPVQVLDEPGRKAQNKSYMWVMKGGPPDQQVVLYHYEPSRGQHVPETLLGDFQGYLQTDGYAGYNGVLKNDDITGVGCFAHARRKFIDAEKALPKGITKSG